MSHDVRLIDDAAAALARLDWEPPQRTSPTQLLLVRPGLSGSAQALYVDALNQTVRVTSYPLSQGDPVPEARMLAVAELMNLIACTGVAWALALDLDRRIPSLHSHVHFWAEPIAEPEPMLRHLILLTAGAASAYEPSLRQVAFEGVEPATAMAKFAEWEQQALDP